MEVLLTLYGAVACTLLISFRRLRIPLGFSLLCATLWPLVMVAVLMGENDG